MKWSTYNHLFESQKFGYLLYNSESNSFAKLNKDMFYLLNEIAIDSNKINKLDESSLKSLVTSKILIDEKNERDFFYEKKFNYQFNSFDSSNLGLAIAPTTHCNFDCPYCYEENRLPNYMDEATIDHLIEFIKNHDRIKKLGLTWYGGEPLLAFKTIKKILAKIAKTDYELDRHGIVTNGYLLDKEKAIFFKDHNLTHVQITIDGAKEYHNQRRTPTSGTPTYDKILDNIDTFFKYNSEAFVTIRMNLDNVNIDSFYDTYNELLKRWKGNRIGIYPAFIIDHTENCTSQCSIVDRTKIVNFYTELYKKNGVNIQFFPEHHIGGCGATNINYFVIGPKGEMYKCWNDIGVKERIIGNVSADEVQNYKVLTRYLAGPTMFDDQECIDCKLFPVCDGGCSWLRQKNVFEGTSYDICTNRKGNINKFLELHYEQQLNNELVK